MKIQECDSFHYKNAINLKKKRNNYLVTKLTKTLFYYLIIV